MQPVKADYLPIEKLKPFEDHPFKVLDNEEMDRLVFSILTQGVMTPLVVRPLEDGNYEIISGHRRLYACQKAGIETVPALVYTLDRDAAAIALVDSNLHREHILPSEKAFAYKLKMDALSHQGTSCQLGTKLRSDKTIAENAGESARQVQRYIRLTNLIPPLLQMVDEGRIALTPAVELSYLQESEQQKVLDSMEAGDCTPSLSQAVQMKKLSQEKLLEPPVLERIMAEPKANQKEKISFKMDDLKPFFPKGYDAARIQETILKLLTEYQKKRQRNHSR